MHPIRILILLALFYILYRIITGSSGSKEQPQSKLKQGSDTLEEDPICHTYIPRQEAVTLKDKGKTLYFCSKDCRHKYQQRNQD